MAVIVSTKSFVRLASNRASSGDSFILSTNIRQTGLYPVLPSPGLRQDQRPLPFVPSGLTTRKRQLKTVHTASFISKMEENSGVKFQQAVVALGRQWVGNDLDNEGTWQPDSVSMVLPADNSNIGVGVEGTKVERKIETYPLPKTVDEARQIIERFEHGADELRSDENVADNVVQHMLRDSTNLLDEKWAGTPEEERSAFVSELLYIHSKVMIVDDRRVIVSLLPPLTPLLLTEARADGFREHQRP